MGDFAGRKKKEQDAGSTVAAPGTETFWAGVAKGATRSLIDSRGGSTVSDPAALLPWIDVDDEARTGPVHDAHVNGANCGSAKKSITSTTMVRDKAPRDTQRSEVDIVSDRAGHGGDGGRRERHARPAVHPATAASASSTLAAFGDAGVELAAVGEHLRIPGVTPDLRGLLAQVDHDQEPIARPTERPAADAIAAMKAAALNVELTTLRYGTDKDKKYKLADVLERADDSTTRQKLKEQYQATNHGQTIDEMITSSDGLDDHARKHARDLVSDKRDAATDALAAMDPKARDELENKAAVWADKLLKVTRSDDRDDSEHADAVASILGPRKPEELEAIRARVMLETSGTKRRTLFEELDRQFSERDRDIGLAGLSGDRVHLASTQLVDASLEGDSERVRRIVKELGPEKLAELRKTNPILVMQIVGNMPDDARAQVDAELGGRQDVADGLRIASLLRPVEISTAEAHDVDDAKRKLARKEAQDPERMIAELQRMSAGELAAAKNAWNDGKHDKTWEELFAEQYKDVDPTLRLRIEAAANGDTRRERALRLRQGMRTFDQDLIDQALADPDLQSTDPKKKAAAEANRRDLEGRMREYDAADQRTQSLVDGRGPAANVAGRSLQEQLDAHYEAAQHHDVDGGDSWIDQAKHVAEKDERMERIREKATVDRFAATEMWTEGDARASTKVRRAELTGNTMQKAEILERLDKKDTKDSNNTLAAQSAEYARKFGNRDMLATPDMTQATEVAKLAAHMTGDDRPPEEIAAQVVRANMNVGEVRMQHVRETGALADRTREQRAAQQQEIHDVTTSAYVAGTEKMQYVLGGNAGSEDLLQSQINLLHRANEEGVSDEEFARRDRSTTSAVELQREEKQRHAAKVAQVLSIASKIAAILTANPALFVAVDAGFSALRIAAQEMIANEAYDMTADLQHIAVDLVVNIATAKLAGLGKGLEAGTQAAKTAQNLQRAGNAAAAMTGAAAHSMIDGEDGGGSVARAGLGAFVPDFFSDWMKGAFKGSGRAATWMREGAGAIGSTSANLAIGGSDADLGTGIDLVGNTVQGRIHNHRGPKATDHEHARMERHAPSDVDLPRASSNDDALRRTPTTPTPPHHDPYAKIDEHARNVEARHAAAQQVNAHFADDDGPSYASTSPLHAGDATTGGHHVGASSQRGSSLPAERPAATAESRPEDFRRRLGEHSQDRANAERAEKHAGKQAELAEIDRLAALATTKADWDYIRELEHKAGRPVSERYSPHDEMAALQQYERAGGLKHADGTPMTPEEAKAWIAKTRAEFQPAIDARTREHDASVAALKSDLDQSIAARDQVKTSEIVAKVETAPIDQSGRRVVTVDEAISVGMGGAGSTGAKQGRPRQAEVVTRTDRMGIEDATKPELWGTLGTKPAGQEAKAISYGTTGAHTVDIAEHPTAQVAKASELALQVAAQRDHSEVGTVGSQGPIGELVIKRVEGPDGEPVLEVGVPVKMKVGDEIQTVVITTTKGVDIASGMGPARQLTTEVTANARQAQQIDSAYASTLKQSGALMSGEQALAQDATHFAGKRVLGIGGGPTSVWAGEHAHVGGAASVEIVGSSPKPPPGSPEGKQLSALEAQIRLLVTSGQEVPIELTQQHHAITEAHVQKQLERLDELATMLRGELEPLARERALSEQAVIKGNIDPFMGSRVDRNQNTLNNDDIHHSQADVMLVRPSADGAVEVVFSDGTRTVVDQVIPSIGPDPNEPGGINSMLKALPKGVDLVPVVVAGRVVGLESDPPGLTISGASLTGTTGLNMPEALLKRIPDSMRDAVVSNLIDHANRQDVSDGSRGIVPGIENVGDAPERMQEARMRSREDQVREREEFLEAHRDERAKYGRQPRFSDQQLKIERREQSTQPGETP